MKNNKMISWEASLNVKNNNFKMKGGVNND
jgi:hypothetical protein